MPVKWWMVLLSCRVFSDSRDSLDPYRTSGKLWPLCQMPPDTDTGLCVGRPYTSRGVQSTYTFVGTSESFHFGSCAEMVSVALLGL